MPPPFTVIEPAGEETPLVVEVPHAGLFVDAPTLARLMAPARAIGRDADLYVDELYADVPSQGATLLTANVSRYVCDLNRGELDVDAESVEDGPPHARATRGIVWRITGEGARALDSPLPRSELERRLDTYHRPYHGKLAAILERKRARFGFAILLAAHSMPSIGRSGVGDVQTVRADVVPGTRGRTSAAPSFIDAVETRARAAALSVVHDDPYQGGYTTRHYGRPDLHVHVVQVELARRLYMDEQALTKSPGFDRTRTWCTSLAAALGATRP